VVSTPALATTLWVRTLLPTSIRRPLSKHLLLAASPRSGHRKKERLPCELQRPSVPPSVSSSEPTFFLRQLALSLDECVRIITNDNMGKNLLSLYPSFAVSLFLSTRSSQPSALLPLFAFAPPPLSFSASSSNSSFSSIIAFNALILQVSFSSVQGRTPPPSSYFLLFFFISLASPRHHLRVSFVSIIFLVNSSRHPWCSQRVAEEGVPRLLVAFQYQVGLSSQRLSLLLACHSDEERSSKWRAIRITFLFPSSIFPFPFWKESWAPPSSTVAARRRTGC